MPILVPWQDIDVDGVIVDKRVVFFFNQLYQFNYIARLVEAND